MHDGHASYVASWQNGSTRFTAPDLTHQSVVDDNEANVGPPDGLLLRARDAKWRQSRTRSTKAHRGTNQRIAVPDAADRHESRR